LLAEGDLHQAQAVAEHALERARPLEHVAEAHIVLARVYAALGRSADAGAHAVDAVAQATRLASPRLLSLGHLAMAEAAAATQSSGVEARLETALSHARAAHAPYDEASVLEFYAAFLERGGRGAALAAGLAARARALRQQL